MSCGRAIIACTFAWVLLLAGCGGTNDPSSILITNVDILDGSGTPAYRGSVRVVDGTIVSVSDISDPDPTTHDGMVYHGGGLILAPGFIDTHSHADANLFAHADALAATSQGITTVVVGQDGTSRFPLAEFTAQIEVAPVAVNVASYVGHNTLRNIVLGEDSRRAATRSEVVEMRRLLHSEMDAGALGLSTGLEYEPGIYSERGEVLALAQVASAAGGRLISHMRSEDRELEAAIGEIVQIGRVTGMPVKISHFKLAMKSLWGQAPRLLATLDQARSEGVDITADAYPYEYWQSTMMVLLPDRDPDDRAAVEFALEELAPPEGILFSRFDPQPEFVGKRLSEIASLMETDAATAFAELARASIAMNDATGAPSEAIIGTSMHAADVAAIIAWEHTNVCTDGGLVDRHPRGRGSFTRVLGRFVDSRPHLSVETLVRKMSGLPADHLGLKNRGYIREGFAGDLVLFDPERVIDRATPEEPDRLSEGIAAVWVNGELAFSNGSATSARSGQFISR